jgi:hypothetical protein
LLFFLQQISSIVNFFFFFFFFLSLLFFHSGAVVVQILEDLQTHRQTGQTEPLACLTSAGIVLPNHLYSLLCRATNLFVKFAKWVFFFVCLFKEWSMFLGVCWRLFGFPVGPRQNNNRNGDSAEAVWRNLVQ